MVRSIHVGATAQQILILVEFCSNVPRQYASALFSAAAGQLGVFRLLWLTHAPVKPGHTEYAFKAVVSAGADQISSPPRNVESRSKSQS